MSDRSQSSVTSKGSHLFALPAGTKLLEFEIEAMLGHGGFGITYRAVDTLLRETVAIKEFLPNELAVRTPDATVRPKSDDDAADFAAGLKAFLEEARVITRFRHPNIVHVRRFFETNGTGYIVLDYERGRTLGQELAEGPLPNAQLRSILIGLLEGLETIHDKAVLHRDLKPSNIILREDGSPVLIDFGAARDFVERHSRSITAIAAPGYSPPEQYGVGGRQGPWTDLYALGAIGYRCVTGAVPIDSLRRLRKDPLVPASKIAAGKYDDDILRAIDWMLAIEEADRPASARALRDVLFKTPEGQRRAGEAAPAGPRKTGRRLALAGLVVVSAAGIAAALLAPERLRTLACGTFEMFCPEPGAGTQIAAPAPAPTPPPVAASAPPPVATPVPPPVAATPPLVAAPAPPPIASPIPTSPPAAAPPPAATPAQSPATPPARAAADAPAAPAVAAAPAAPPPPQASPEEQLAWSLLRDSRDPGQLQNFVRLFPNSPHRAEILARLAALAPAAAPTPSPATPPPASAATGAPAAPPSPQAGPDEAAWKFLKDSRDAGQLQNFVRLFPNSPHRAEALARLASLGQPAAAPPAQGASPVTPPPAQSTPPVAPPTAPTAAPTPSPDAATWDIVKNTTDLQLLRAFVERYPNSAHKTAASARIAVLEQEKAEDARRAAAARQAALQPPTVSLDDATVLRDGQQLGELRRRLYELNFDPGSSDTDSKELTEAIREFEGLNALRLTGLPTAGLLQRLRQTASPRPWGTIVVQLNPPKYGMSWNHSTRAEAVAAARRSCGAACPLEISFFGRNCGALAYAGTNIYAQTSANGIAAAKADALAQCRTKNRNCSVAATICADGSSLYEE